MRRYYRLVLGPKNAHAPQSLAGGFIGAAFGINDDLSDQLPDGWPEFNRRFIPVYLTKNPDKTKIGAGLACGALWTVAKGIRQGDVVLCPDGTGTYRPAEVIGDYSYAATQPLPHRRKVRWLERAIARSDMSAALQSSMASPGTVVEITQHQAEIERLLGASPTAAVMSSDPNVEDPIAFAMEKHLEAFLVTNWKQTMLGQDFSIYEEDGALVGQQYPTAAGPIDVLAVSKDRKRLLVIELKRGRASDVVVGQILRYMGFVREHVAEPDQSVEGAIIALEDDQKMRWALTAVPAVNFYRYEIDFRLVKG